jgi:drug/metabolite transporter (DMT)-like permease
MHESLAFLVRGWSMPGLADLLMMMACGAIAAIGLTLLTQAYRLADASLLAPFEYVALFWALAWGWLVWGDWPTSAVWAGIAILVATGLFLFYLERPRAPLAAQQGEAAE